MQGLRRELRRADLDLDLPNVSRPGELGDAGELGSVSALRSISSVDFDALSLVGRALWERRGPAWS